ncbi:MAG: response regulator [Gammaproteobacteria bacterium]|nr:response regulator [Gammaproteobacteria bacterium]
MEETPQQTILIIEDNPTSRKLLRVALQCEHYHVLEAEDGKTALEIAKNNKPDLILQDLILPDIDGAELNKQLRALPHLYDIPIFAVSGFLNSIEEMQSMSVGFTAFVTKPIELTRLMSMIKTYFPEIPKEKIGKGHEVLLVDDDVIQRKLLRLQLMNAGFRVNIAENGKAALQQLAISMPAAVLSDVLMPCIDGFELCLAIRRNPETAHLPVILLTSHYIEKADEELGDKIQASAYLIRNPNTAELMSTLERLINNKQEIQHSMSDITLFKEEHTHRLIRQLEHQIITNTGLAQQCALVGAQLSILNSITEALSTNSGIDKSLQEVLGTCLDAAGISQGILYLTDGDNKLNFYEIIGYAKNKLELDTFFGHLELLHQIIETKEILQIPSKEIDPKISNVILSRNHITSALLIPLAVGEECFGLLFIGSKTTNIADTEPLTFARSLGNQAAQSIALAAAFKRLGDSENRYHTLMDNARCGMIVINIDGEIVEINKQVELLLCRENSDIIGKNILSLVTEADHDYIQILLNKLMKNGSIDVNDVRIYRQDGSSRMVEFSGAIMHTIKKDLIVLMTNDITEHNQFRSQAMMNDRLTTVGILASGVAHEINNPVAWVLSNLAHLKMQLTEIKARIDELPIWENTKGMAGEVQLNEGLINFETIINETISGAERVKEIVRNLKGFARAADNEDTEIDIHEVLNSAINMAYPAFKYHAGIEKKYGNNLPKIVANNGKLHQVFLNLIINAFQSISERDEKNNKICVSTTREAGYIKVAISDTGSGISPDILPKIFDPFFTTKFADNGTGLGLSICHEIIHNLGGNITVESIQHKGSTFLVSLPISIEILSPSKKEKIITHNEITKRRLLIIDDEPYLLKSMQRLLGYYHHVTIALGGRAGLAFLTEKEVPFDVVLCDLSMPDLDGVDLYNYLCKENLDMKNQIIFMTGGAYVKKLEEFVKNDALIFVDKPFDIEVLLKTIDDICIKDNTI